MDEVVVTGTAGAARKREVGNSIGQLRVADAPDVPTNVSNLLAGKLAGVAENQEVEVAAPDSAVRAVRAAFERIEMCAITRTVLPLPREAVNRGASLTRHATPPKPTRESRVAWRGAS